MTTFERIKKISKKRGYSLKKLAEKANLSENVVYSWKRKVPSTESLKKVSKALGVTLNDLIEDTEESIETNNTVDLNDLSTVMTFQGEPIPEKYKEIVRDLLKNLKDKEENEK